MERRWKAVEHTVFNRAEDADVHAITDVDVDVDTNADAKRKQTCDAVDV